MTASEDVGTHAGFAVIIVAGRRRSLNTLRDELAMAAPDLPVVVVGDALSPRMLLDATAEGARAGATIGALTERYESSR